MSAGIVGGGLMESPSTVFTHYSKWIQVAFLIPYPGTCHRSDPYDIGWLHQGADHNGQKDVEHLDADGTVVPRNLFTDLRKTAGTSTLKPPIAVQSFLLPRKKGTTTSTEWYSVMLPYLGSVCRSRDRVGKTSSSAAVHPYRYTEGAYWPRSYLSVAFASSCQLDDATKTTDVSAYVAKYNADHTLFVSKAITFAAPAGLDWPAVQQKVTERAVLEAASMTPVSSVAASSYETTFESAFSEVSPKRLTDRSYLFGGELNPVWGDLAYDCYSQIQLWNSNGLSYGRDLMMITTSVRELVASAKSLLVQKNLPSFAKNMADLFLSFRYGWSLTSKDTLSLLETDYSRAYPMGRCKRSSSYTYFRDGNSITARMAVYCRPYSDSVSELAGFLQMMDLDLTAENIWDLIPLSFVVDWVANVGDVLDRFDKLAQLDRYSIFLTGRSLKASTTVAPDRIPGLQSVVGTISATYYKRQYGTDVIPPSLSSSRTSNQKFSHWLEGTALVVQRLA